MDMTFSFPATTRLANRRRLKAFIADIFSTERTQASSLSIVFCSDPYLLGINQAFLKHDDYTDIITFNLADPKSKVIIGELYISVDRVRANAKTFGVQYGVELHRVIFHGVLHLCGFADKTKTAKALMREKEDYYLKLYGLL